LTGEELEFWLADQRINRRGVAVDRDDLLACARLVEICLQRYDAELHQLTGGAVERASQLERLKGWLAGQGVYVGSGPGSMDEDGIAALLENLGRPRRRFRTGGTYRKVRRASRPRGSCTGPS